MLCRGKTAGVTGEAMISHQYRCIFVEVPKTGTTSIRSILGNPRHPHLDVWELKHELETQWTRHNGRWDKYYGAWYGLKPEKERRDRGRAIFDSYFKFGFVRNPWDRTVSLYERRESAQLHKEITFDEFVDRIRYSTFTCMYPSPKVNQLDWMVDPSGNVIVDFIGRFERLEEDWRLVADKLDIDRPLPHGNRNPQRIRHYTDYYTPRTRDIVARRFAVDIETFGYEFGASADDPGDAGRASEPVS
jgi:Sulfotransferase family